MSTAPQLHTTPPEAANRLEDSWLWQWTLHQNSPFAGFERLPALPDDPAMAYSFATNYNYRFSAVCRQMELAGALPPDIHRLTRGVRRILGESVFVRHLQTWPHGYPGDWEIVEQILDGRNKSPEGTWAWYFEQAALHTPAATQHSRKIAWQSKVIARTICQKPDCRVLSLACGGSRDFDLALRDRAPCAAAVVLNDAEERALTHSRERLAGRVQALEIRPGNAIHVARALRDEEPFDLVLAGGLFDYLPDRAAVVLLKAIAPKLLQKDGAFLFTNIGCDNPCRPWMEYAVDWRLIERSPEDILRLCGSAGLATDGVRIERDETGLTLLVTVGGV